MAFSFEAPDEALNEEAEREGVVLEVVLNLRNDCNFSYLCITASSMSINSCNCYLDFSWWVILVQVDYLDVLLTLLSQFY